MPSAPSEAERHVVSENVAAFGSVLGAVGCELGGARWVNLSMAVSGTCCVVIGFFFGGPF